MRTDEFLKIMKKHDSLFRDLRYVQSLGLPESCIAAGYIRNYVWDYLHGYIERSPLNDVDVLYYDAHDLQEETEKEFEHRLRTICDEYNWSVKNQARLHLRNQHPPYTSIEDAMNRWPETATAIGIGLTAGGELKIYAPHGVNDLLDMVVRRSPYFVDHEYYWKRVRDKKWLTRWPKLTFIH